MKVKNVVGKKIIVVGLCVLLTFSVFGCGKTDDSGTNVNNNVSAFQEEISDEEIGMLEIETPYGTLYYTDIWEENIVINQEEADVYKVSFCGKLDEKEEVLLFDVCFGVEDENLVGYVELDEIVPISVKIHELQLENDWTEEEKNCLYSMQEEVNGLIDEIHKLENFRD